LTGCCGGCVGAISAAHFFPSPISAFIHFAFSALSADGVQKPKELPSNASNALRARICCCLCQFILANALQKYFCFL
jgi:hypothetical protein